MLPTSVDMMLVPEAHDLHAAPGAPQLWQLLVGMLQGPAEADFVREVIGEDVVKGNEMASKEVTMLLSILSDLRANRADQATSTDAHCSPLRSSAAPTRELLQERLRILLSQARVQIPADQIFSTPRERQIADFVLTGNRPRSARTSSSLSRSIDSRPTSAASSHADPFAGIQGLKNQLHFDSVQKVKEDLRACFHEEKRAVLSDIDFVRQLIEEEMHRPVADFDDPTDTEIKQMTRVVEAKQEQQRHENLIRSLPSAPRKASLPTLAPLGK